MTFGSFGGAPDDSLYAALEPLGLAPETVAAFADVHAGYAHLAAERAEADLPADAGPSADADSSGDSYALAAASGFVLAAAHRSLVDPRGALGDYALAAFRFARSRSTFAGVLGICAGLSDDVVGVYAGLTRPPTREISAAGDATSDADVDVDRPLAHLLGRAWIDGPPPFQGDPGGAADEGLASPVGRLGVPLGAYARATSSFRRELGAPPRVDALAAFLRRAAEPVAGAMADRYHWRRLYSAVLPAEPEFVALCRVAIRRWRGQFDGAALLGLVREQIDDALALVPLRVALALDRADGASER